MSTRCLIAAPDRDHKWIGVYHHSDGYPDGMGVYLTRIFDALRGDADLFRSIIIDNHPAGWSHLFPSSPMGHYQGVDRLQICGRTYDACQSECAISSCYCHDPYFTERGDRAGSDLRVRGDQLLNTWCEWLYLVTPDGIATYRIIAGEHDEPDRLGDPHTDLEKLIASLADGDPDYLSQIGFTDQSGWAWRAPLPAFIQPVGVGVDMVTMGS